MMPRSMPLLTICCYLLVELILNGCSSRGIQTLDADREITRPLIASIGQTVHTASDAFINMPQTPAQTTAFQMALTALVTGDRKQADAFAAKAGYDIQRLDQDGKSYLKLQDQRHPVVGATVYLATTPSRDIILSAPHPVVDRLTNIEAAIALPRLGARALILAGASRCAALQKSSCSGRTSVCGSRERYRVSDVAHNPDTLFHLAHAVLTQHWSDSVVVQLHGFNRRDTDAWVVLSDGSFAKRPQGQAFTERVRDQIRVRLGAKNKAVSCQDPTDEKYTFRTLCARTNVQGRALNGSPDTCEQSTQTASGRFLHVEQSWDIRQPFRANWFDIHRYPKALAVIDAIADVVPCSLSPCGSVATH